MKLQENKAQEYDYGFVTPLMAEAKPLIQKLSNKKKLLTNNRLVYVGKLGNKSIAVTVSGCGKIKSASTTQFLIDNYPSTLYVHYGTAGALAPDLKIGDIVIATKVIEHDFKELFPEVGRPPEHKVHINAKFQIRNNLKFKIWRGTILSGDEDIVGSKRKRELYGRYKGLSVDWESAGFALTCNLNRRKSLVLRGISDLAYEHTASEYKANQKLAINNILQLLGYILKKTSTSRSFKP